MHSGFDPQFLPENPPASDLARELLRYRMLEYSEDFWCASWLVDLEFAIWDLIDTARSDYERQLGADCRKLAEIAGGWWVYDHTDKEPAGRGPHFISLERWRQLLVQRETKPDRSPSP